MSMDTLKDSEELLRFLTNNVNNVIRSDKLMSDKVERYYFHV